jgi:acyl-CoA synthetase (AMP-forming)/AMP-acid ligase II
MAGRKTKDPRVSCEIIAGEPMESEQNISTHLTIMAKTAPYRPAVIFPEGQDFQGRVAYTHYTYLQLETECQFLAKGLMKIGIVKGTRTVLMVKPSLDFFALTFALFRIGAIPILIDPGLGVKGIGQCLDKIEPQAFVGILKANMARALFRWSRNSIKITINVGKPSIFSNYCIQEIRALGTAASDLQLPAVKADDPAAILFTSGSTGAPKGAQYTHRNFNRQVELLKSVYGIQPGEIDLCTFPLFALFSAGLGITAIIPDMDFTRPAKVDPEKIFRAIAQFGVTNMFGSPALLKRIAPAGIAKKIFLPTIRRVISAGAPVSVETLRSISQLLPPSAQIFTPYGATEALPVCSIGSHEILAENTDADGITRGICVGKPVDGIDLKIIKITDSPIKDWASDLEVEAGTIGEIVVRGPQVSASYYNHPPANSLGKIKDIETDEIIHRMGDLGYLDEQGRLWFCGRKSHRVITNEETLYTIPCESVFNTHERISRTALVGIGKKGNERPVICVETNENLTAGDKIKIRQELLELGSRATLTRNVKTVAFYSKSFPVDIRHNSKIFREKLKIWAEGEIR